MTNKSRRGRRRLSRPAVGALCAEGCRFTERLLTVVHTLKLQKRPVFEYLKSALRKHRVGKHAPSLRTASWGLNGYAFYSTL